MSKFNFLLFLNPECVGRYIIYYDSSMYGCKALKGYASGIQDNESGQNEEENVAREPHALTPRLPRHGGVTLVGSPQGAFAEQRGAGMMCPIAACLCCRHQCILISSFTPLLLL